MTVREPTPGQIQAATDLFELLVEGDQTYVTLNARMGWTRNQILKYVQVLRDVLATDADTISVTCDPDPDDPLGPWVYTLRAGTGIVDPENTRWLVNRLGDAERRLVTIRHVVDIAAQTLDGRSNDGKKARIYALHLKRAEEEVAMLTSDGQAPGL
jgi:hypothetical protein